MGCVGQKFDGIRGFSLQLLKMALVMVAEEICKGDRLETGVGVDGKEQNPFQWNHIRLNLPGTDGYDPCTTWISKRREDGRIACDVFVNPRMRTNSLCIMRLPICDFFCLTPRTLTGTPRMHTGTSF
jgi:hypothetical protein